MFQNISHIPESYHINLLLRWKLWIEKTIKKHWIISAKTIYWYQKFVLHQTWTQFLIKQIKLVPAFRPWNQILMHFDKMSTNRHCKHFAQFSEITGWRQVAIVFFQNNFSFALDPPTLSNGQMWKKSAPNHPGKPIHPTPLTGNATMETTHFKKGLPWGGWGSWGDLALWGSWAKSVMDWMGDTH